MKFLSLRLKFVLKNLKDREYNKIYNYFYLIHVFLMQKHNTLQLYINLIKNKQNMSNFNPDQIFYEKLKLYFNSENPNINFFLKFAMLIDIIISKRSFISKSNIAPILQNELTKKTKKISLEYELFESELNQIEKESSSLIGILRIELIDNLIGYFAGKLDVNANFKSFKNASNQNYFIPLNCNCPELKNLRFENLNETYQPLDNFLNENLILKIFAMNNLNKLTINFTNTNTNTNKINTNLQFQANVFNNSLQQQQNEKKYISDYNNFNFNNKNTNSFPMNTYNNNNNSNQMNPNIISGGNPNIHLTSEEIPVGKKTENLEIGKNKFYERNKGDIEDPNFENNYNQKQKLSKNNKKTEADEIYEQEINVNNLNNPSKIGGNPKLQVPFDKRVPKQDYWDPSDPFCEVFNPNYQINPNKYINPHLNEGNFIMPGGNNPFFSSEGGMVPGGELVGPESDIFSKDHPHNMLKKPGAKIRYDPIGPFGTFGGPDKGNKHDDPFQG